MEKYDFTRKEKEGLSYTCAKPFRFEREHQVKNISSLQGRGRSNGQTVFEDDLFLIPSISKKNKNQKTKTKMLPNGRLYLSKYRNSNLHILGRFYLYTHPPEV